MTRFSSGPVIAAIATLLLAGCGSSRQLQSVNLSPATADARSFPGGQVQFSATGSFNKPPSPTPLTSADVTWCVGSGTGQCDGNIAQGATIDQNGVAQCGSGFVGTVTILAGTAGTPVLPDQGQPLKIFGSATLTCP